MKTRTSKEMMSKAEAYALNLMEKDKSSSLQQGPAAHRTIFECEGNIKQWGEEG